MRRTYYFRLSCLGTRRILASLFVYLMFVAVSTGLSLAQTTTIQIAATNSDGTNTGTARLGAPVTLFANESSGPYLVGWTLQGGGSIGGINGAKNQGAVYTPPTAMPSSSSVTITAYLKNTPTVTTTYTLALVNPVPTVTSVSPAQLLSGGTQSVSLIGSGFAPGMVVAFNGSSLSANVTSFTQASVQVPVSATATGPLSLQVQNPAPGGGAGTTFSETVASSSISLTATGLDGTNSGADSLGNSVTMTAAVTGTLQTAVNWSVSGAGSITASGVYTAPTTMPGSNAVTITGTLASNSAISASYSLNIVNPAPSITASSVAALQAGLTTPVTLTGTGFVPGTVLLPSFGTATVTYQSPTSLLAQISVPITVTGKLTLQAQNPAPSGGTSGNFQIPTSQGIQLSASNPDGANTGTGRLGVPVNLTATVSPGNYATVSWAVQGAGTLTSGGSNYSSGTYTPPTAMPGTTTVTIVASLKSLPSVTTSYTLTLINPVPAVTTASPTQVLTGQTQPIALVGSGFVSGMSATWNGSPLATTVTDYNHATVQLPVAANATGSMTLQLQNPSPGGGAGSSFVESIAGNSITLTATGVDGINTGSVALENSVTMTASVSGSAQTAVNWSSTGAGSISASGVYTAPPTVTGSNIVTITATLASNPSVTASYQLNILNPLPTVSSSSPSQLLTGGTQTLSLVGSGFVQGTVVLFNGTTLPTALIDYTHVSLQLPVAGNATGPLSLQVQNPAPGGGTGTTFAVSIPANSISLTATGQDGVNSGQVLLSNTVSVAAAVTGSMQTAVTWSVSGAGSISTSGVYTAPATMPGTNAVTITATLTSNPAITASYALNILNPAPVITSAAQSQVSAGTTTAVTLTGTGFVPGTAFTVDNGGTVTTTYQSPTSIIAQVTLPITASNKASLQATNATPGGGTSSIFQIPIGQGIQLTASSPDGTNPATARLGVPVNLTASVSPGNNQLVSWSLQGPGTITYSGASYVNGLYTPPAAMPTNTSVTITASLTNNQAVTTSYSLTLNNPIPSVTSSSPTQVTPGITQPVSLVGSGFIAGTVVLLNGTSLPISLTDYNHATVQVPVASNATNSISLQVQNPAPGGGAGTTFTESIASGAIALTATGPDGVNTGAGILGTNVTMAAHVTGSAQTAVTWSVAGAGSISSSGVYTAPVTLPANTAVSITATLTSNTSITASYSLTLINPDPNLTSANPAQAPAGLTSSVTITGNGFTPATVLSVSTGTVTTTYQSPTTLIAQITPPGTATGSMTISALNPAPGGGTSGNISLTIGQSVQLAATNPDGNNTGTGRLGVPVSLVATVSPGKYASLTWTLTGAGTLTKNGATATYTPPQAMPANTTVGITAYLTSLPSVTTTYTLTTINPVPAVTSATPTKVTAGLTQTVSMVGSGFVAGTTVVVNGTSLPITLTDYSHASAQVPVAANATAPLSLQVQNPAPGGGAGTTFSETIATPAITLVATNSDGTNTGTARLGVNVTVAATVTGSAQTALTWTVTGAGSVSTSGLYTPPTSMPGSSAVTITAALTSNPSVTASYALSLVNPIPAISVSAPAQVAAATTTTITLTGNGFVPGTVITTNTGTVTATYVSPTSMTAQLVLPLSAFSKTVLQAQNPTPGGGTSATFNLPVGQGIQLVATNPDGTNTGTARLGVPVSVTGATSPGNYAKLGWTLTGPGTLNFTGTNNVNATYTPPQSLTGSPAVTVTAYLTSAPSVTTTYAISLINPTPAVTSASPTQLLTGGTQPVALVGSGFITGTVVVLNGSSLPITLTDYSHATVQVPVPANATGTLSLQVQNPAPGGGSGTTFTESIAASSITLTATGQDGTNSGAVTLGNTVAMSAAVAGSAQASVTWTVAGAGSISSSGIYVAPAALPGNNAVTITAALVSNPAITASYQLNILNPVPTITGSNPISVPAGATTTFVLTGTGFVPTTTLLASTGTVTVTYQSSTTLTAQVTLSSSASGNLALQAQNPAPGGGTSLTLDEAIATPISVSAAARLLDQTTFGPTTSLISHVQGEGINAWLTEQFNTPPTFLANLPPTNPSYCANASYMCAQSEWWQAALNANDQLRQRVAFVLGQIFVISTTDMSLTGKSIPPYSNALLNDAFGNWYNIMTDTALSPGMGLYLDMLDSAAATGPSNIADENFARENMQLFNVGINMLHTDGTLKLDGNGNPIPAYTQAQVQAFAKVFTGWTWANPDGSSPSSLIGTANYTHPMVAVEAYHDMTSKTLLNGTVLPAGQTAEQDFAAAMTNVFQHPNVAPFVCRQLIQHLVTSTPSPAYVARVAAVFNDDGDHVRGDMKSVLIAIFTDPEARAGDTNTSADDGYLREPILWMTGVMRGLGFVNTDPNNYYFTLSVSSGTLDETPWASPSVFNFFPPDYVIPGTSLNAPEFALENTGSVADRLTLADKLVNNRMTAFNVDLSATSPLGQMASNPGNLVDALGVIFMHGQMDPNVRSAIVSYVSSLSDVPTRVRVAAYLVITASQYKIVH